MILEHAVLNVIKGQERAFEAAMQKAAPLISASPGFLGMEVRQNASVQNQYLLLVRWESTAHHTEGFRTSDRYQHWKALLHHCYELFPEVSHFDAPIVALDNGENKTTS